MSRRRITRQNDHLVITRGIANVMHIVVFEHQYIKFLSLGSHLPELGSSSQCLKGCSAVPNQTLQQHLVRFHIRTSLCPSLPSHAATSHPLHPQAMPFLKQLFATLVVLSVSLHTEAFTTRMCHHQEPYYLALFSDRT